MIVRIIIFILILKFHKQIYNWFLQNNLFSISGFMNQIEKSVDKVAKTITTNGIKKQMLILKSIDLNAYKEVKRRLKNIDGIYEGIFNNLDISLKNEYQNIKEEKNKIKNRIVSISVSKGLKMQTNQILNVIEKYINDLEQNILDERDRRGINTEWFEGTLYNPIMDYDPNTNYNYDYYV